MQPYARILSLCHPKTNTSNNQEKIHVDHKLGSTTANDVSREEKPSTVNRQPIRNHQPSTLKIIYMKRFQSQANTHVRIYSEAFLNFDRWGTVGPKSENIC